MVDAGWQLCNNYTNVNEVPMKTLRYYQQDASDAGLAYLDDPSNLGGLITLPTGSGKSLVMADLIKRLYVSGYMKIMVIAHKRELISQNHAEALEHIEDMASQPSLGICCAGLGSTDTKSDVIFATIQSVFRKPSRFVPVDLVLIDEAHMISRTKSTMYRKFIDGLDVAFPVPVLGLTATPYRLEGTKTNALIGGKTALFDEMIHETPAQDLVDEGFLTPIVTVSDVTPTDVSKVRTSGDFVQSELEKVVTVPDVVRRNVDETLRYAKGRKCWLIFCCGQKHAEAVYAAFLERGYDLPIVSKDTPSDYRDYVLGALKTGKMQGAINIEVATTGFDAKPIDMIAMMRPTKSKGLFIQVLGRGMRMSEMKNDCLLLDFGSNVERLGTSFGLPFAIGEDRPQNEWTCETILRNDIEVLVGCGHVNAAHRRSCEECGAVRPAGFGPTKECEKCHTTVSVSARSCPECGALFLKLDNYPSNITFDETRDGGVKLLPVDNFFMLEKRTSSGKDMLIVVVKITTGLNYWCTYYPKSEYYKSKRKFNKLHDLLSNNEITRPPESSQEAKFFYNTGVWQRPEQVKISQDKENFYFLSAVSFDKPGRRV